MKKTTYSKIALVISIVLIAAFLLSACESPSPRIPERHFFNPGGAFSINVNDEDPRRQVRATVVFQVIDEAAIQELTDNTSIIRNSVLSVLGEITIPELTTHKDLDNIALRIVERVNEDLGTGFDLIIGAYFSELALV